MRMLHMCAVAAFSATAFAAPAAEVDLHGAGASVVFEKDGANELVVNATWLRNLEQEIQALKARPAGFESASSPPFVCDVANEGKIYWDTTSKEWTGCDGTEFMALKQDLKSLADGGVLDMITQNSFKYELHIFKSSGTLTVPSGLTAEILMVGGGGSGGGRHGGGGGGGGVLHGFKQLDPGSYPIVIGQGGTPTYGTDVAGNDGGSTTAFGLTAFGGGGGGTYSGVHGRAGGSGGGGGHSSTNGGAKTQTSQGGLTGYGSAGANNPSGGNEASGGGGAGSAGGQATGDVTGGDGGSGIQIDIDGNNYYWAGGGGGAGWYQHGGKGGKGGGGGGNTAAGGTPGAGGDESINDGQVGLLAPDNGVNTYGGAAGANTGGGGGGSGQADNSNYKSYSGAGGSGIVIIAFDV